MSTFHIRRKVLKLVGAELTVTDDAQAVLAFAKMKAFKLREDIRLYTGPDMKTELLSIHARQIIDFAASYDIFDSKNGQKLGALKRKGLESIIQDKWIIMDANDTEIGFVQEDSIAMALVRRFLVPMIPQNFSMKIKGHTVAEFKQKFNPLVQKMDIDISPENESAVGRLMVFAIGALLTVIEGRQG